jgi:hypothetical protein
MDLYYDGDYIRKYPDYICRIDNYLDKNLLYLDKIIYIIKVFALTSND